MNFNVEGALIQLLNETNIATSSSHMIALLKWASDHPKETKKVMAQLKVARPSFRNNFIRCLETFSDLAGALRWANEKTTRERRHLSAVLKFKAKATKGYTVPFKNDEDRPVKTTVNRTHYTIAYLASNEIVKVVIPKIWLHANLDAFLETVSRGEVFSELAQEILYEGNSYKRDSEIGRLLVTAIEKNENPKILVLCHSPENTES